MSPVAACRVTSGELPPPPPDNFQTQLSAAASAGLGWPLTHISDSLIIRKARTGQKNRSTTFRKEAWRNSGSFTDKIQMHRETNDSRIKKPAVQAEPRVHPAPRETQSFLGTPRMEGLYPDTGYQHEGPHRLFPQNGLKQPRK